MPRISPYVNACECEKEWKFYSQNMSSCKIMHFIYKILKEDVVCRNVSDREDNERMNGV